MKARLLLLFILIGHSNLRAQDSTFVTIKAGSRIKDVLTATDIFFSPEFVRGKVVFKNGVAAIALMNYDYLGDQMLFIDPKGDTLALDAEKTINFIALDKDTFYYVNGYVRLVASNSILKLAERKIWRVADIRKVGAHNIPAKTFDVTAYSTLTNGYGKSYELILNEDVVLRKKAQYSFGNLYNRFAPASKKNLLSFFPKMENILVKYLNENNVNFNKKEDLEKLALFLEQHY
jgi:hypothetical protein